MAIIKIESNSVKLAKRAEIANKNKAKTKNIKDLKKERLS